MRWKLLSSRVLAEWIARVCSSSKYDWLIRSFYTEEHAAAVLFQRTSFVPICEPWSSGSMIDRLCTTTNGNRERCMLGSHFRPSSFVLNLPKRSLVSRGSWMNRSCTWCLKAQSKFTLRFLCYVYSLSFFTFLVSLPVLVSCQLYCQDHNGLASEANKRKKIVSLFTDVFLQSDPFCNSVRCRLSRRNSFGFCWYQQILSDVVSSQI